MHLVLSFEMYGQAPLKDDEYVLERRITAFKWTMMVHHVLSFILALATFCVCIWIRFDLDFWEWVIEIDWYSYWYAVYVIMITMVIVFIIKISVSKTPPLLIL